MHFASGGTLNLKSSYDKALGKRTAKAWARASAADTRGLVEPEPRTTSTVCSRIQRQGCVRQQSAYDRPLGNAS